MKTTELMIGDWVLAQFINGDRYARISCIAIDCAVVSVGDREYEHDFDAVLPIPITEEMLKANGFENETADFWKLRVDDKPHHYSFRLNKGGVFGNEGYNMNCNIYTITISYVHELQHALRLCGLNELANNFKVNGNA